MTSVIVEVTHADWPGIVGYGEGYPDAYYGETVETIRAVLPLLLSVAETTDVDLAGDEAGDALARLGDEFADAIAHNGAAKCALERLDNAVKRFGANDQRVIPYRYQLADYYQRSRLPESAREQYAEVLKTQESLLGAGHPGLLDPLRQLVRIDLLTSQTQAGEAHARLVSVLEQNPNSEPVERGLALATLGDWAIVANDSDAARDFYKQAWQALRSQPDFDVAAAFARPEMIDFIAPLSSVDRGEKSKPYAWAEIDLQVPIQQVFPLAEFETAIAAFNVGTLGKLVLTVD